MKTSCAKCGARWRCRRVEAAIATLGELVQREADQPSVLRSAA